MPSFLLRGLVLLALRAPCSTLFPGKLSLITPFNSYIEQWEQEADPYTIEMKNLELMQAMGGVVTQSRALARNRARNPAPSPDVTPPRPSLLMAAQYRQLTDREKFELTNPDYMRYRDKIQLLIRKNKNRTQASFEDYLDEDPTGLGRAKTAGSESGGKNGGDADVIETDPVTGEEYVVGGATSGDLSSLKELRNKFLVSNEGWEGGFAFQHYTYLREPL
jgi:hypothetical protein